MLTIDSDLHRVRLTGGPNRYEGFPDIWYRGRWCTACDLGTFTDENAQVICKMVLQTNETKYVLIMSQFLLIIFILLCKILSCQYPITNKSSIISIVLS